MAVGSLRTPLCDLLGIDYPVLQAGMGREKGTSTPPELVAAVSEAGGLGCLGGIGLDADELREHIREIRRLTGRPFGVNLLLPPKLVPVDQQAMALREQAQRQYPEHFRIVDELRLRHGLPALKVERDDTISNTLTQRQIEAVLDERVPVFVVGLGDSAQVVPAAHARGMKVLGIAASVRHAVRQQATGIDAVIAQGSEAGGHTSVLRRRSGRSLSRSVTTMVLVPQVVDAVRAAGTPLPVIAAGGIVDGRGLVAALSLGAVGVWCGTAFLFAEEANVTPAHREQLDASRSEDLVVRRSYTGKTARMFKNDIVATWSASGLDPLPMPLQWGLMADFLASAQAADRYDLVNNPAGQAAGMLRGRKPAAQLVREMVAEAENVLAALAGART